MNPHLTHSIAEGLTPYINNIAGLPGGLEGFGPLDDPGQWDRLSMPDTKGLFAVLNSEQSAATLWNSEVYKQALLHETAFAQNPSNFGSDRNSPHPPLCGVSSTPERSVRSTPSPRTKTKSRRPNMNGSNSVTTPRSVPSTAGGGSLPGVGPIAGEEIDKVGGALQDEILGTTSPIDSKDPINNMSP